MSKENEENQDHKDLLERISKRLSESNKSLSEIIKDKFLLSQFLYLINNSDKPQSSLPLAKLPYGDMVIKFEEHPK